MAPIQRLAVFTAPASLPDDPTTLKAVLSAALAEIERLHQLIAGLQRHRFGRRSEKLDDAAVEQGAEDLGQALAEQQAGLEAAAAQYRATVLGAFQNVADALNTLQIDADAVAAQHAAVRAAASNLAITEAQFRAGGTSFLALLNAQNAHAQAQIALIQARANRYADTAALYQALGGGWWNRPPATAEQEG